MIGTETTVFIVDDDLSVRKSLLRLIRSGGFHAEAFACAQDLLALPAFPQTGCLILDVRMPGMMGPELCDVMAAKNIALPVIFLTGSAGLPEEFNMCSAGAVDFLVKPVDAEDLLQAVRQAVERHAAAKNHNHRPTSIDRFHSEIIQTDLDSRHAGDPPVNAE